MARKNGEKEAYHNEYGTIVTDYIVTGKTKLFPNRDEAVKHADHRKSYTYAVYLNGEYAGHGVPQ